MSTDSATHVQAQSGSVQNTVLSAARPQYNAGIPVKRRPDRIKPVPITSAAVQNSTSQDASPEANSSQPTAPANHVPQSSDTQLAGTPSITPGGVRAPAARPSSSDRTGGSSVGANSMIPDRAQRGGRGSGRAGPRGGRLYDGQIPGVPAPPSGSGGRSEGPRRGRGGRGGPAGYRQQQAQYQTMPAQSLAAQQVYFPVQSSMYYPPSAFGIPAAVPGLPAISQEQLQLAVRQQIEYYFSVANLVKDVFLRSKMNGEGWISLHVIASFNRVRMLTPDLAMIMEALLDSPTVELSGDSLFIRPKVGYQQWVLPESQRDASAHALPHMPANANSNSMKPAGQAQASNIASSTSDAPAADSTLATDSEERTQANNSKAEMSGEAGEESSIQQAAPATPSNSKQDCSASEAASSRSPLEPGKDSSQPQEGQSQQQSTPANAAAEEHGEEDMFEMDEVLPCVHKPRLDPFIQQTIQTSKCMNTALLSACGHTLQKLLPVAAPYTCNSTSLQAQNWLLISFWLCSQVAVQLAPVHSSRHMHSRNRNRDSATLIL